MIVLQASPIMCKEAFCFPLLLPAEDPNKNIDVSHFKESKHEPSRFSEEEPPCDVHVSCPGCTSCWLRRGSGHYPLLQISSCARGCTPIKPLEFFTTKRLGTDRRRHGRLGTACRSRAASESIYPSLCTDSSDGIWRTANGVGWGLLGC